LTLLHKGTIVSSSTTQRDNEMTTVTYQGHTEVNAPAQFITTQTKYGMEMTTGYYGAAKGFNTDHLVIGQSYEANINNNEISF